MVNNRPNSRESHNKSGFCSAFRIGNSRSPSFCLDQNIHLQHNALCIITYLDPQQIEDFVCHSNSVPDPIFLEELNLCFLSLRA